MRPFALLALLGLVALGCSKKSQAASGAVTGPDGTQRVALSVTENGFEPTPVKVKANQPVELTVTRKTDATCATAIVIDDPPLRRDLPLGQAVVLAFTPKKTGDLVYGCGMGKMLTGTLRVE